jgi:chaperone BCS1
MKVVVIRSDTSFLMILEYLHFHLDNNHERELIYVETDLYIPRFAISEQCFFWNGIAFQIKKSEDYRKSFDVFHRYSELHIEHDSFTVISDFIQECIRYISKNENLQKLCIYRSDYRRWSLETEMKEKTIDTIYFPEKIKTNLLDDITNFTDPKVIKRYTELEINHVRMYMFYGPPGTGKTSLIKSIASYFKRNICYLNIAPDLEDTHLKACITNLPKNSILCLEDIDALFGEERRSKFSLTFSGFINTLDGFATPQNLLVFMTTNNLTQIEHAVIRRISYFVEFKYATKEQVKQMFEKFFPEQTEHFETFYTHLVDISFTINILEKFFIKYLFDDTKTIGKHFAKFANGELKVELNNSSKLYT